VREAAIPTYATGEEADKGFVASLAASKVTRRSRYQRRARRAVREAAIPEYQTASAADGDFLKSLDKPARAKRTVRRSSVRWAASRKRSWTKRSIAKRRAAKRRTAMKIAARRAAAISPAAGAAKPVKPAKTAIKARTAKPKAAKRKVSVVARIRKRLDTGRLAQPVHLRKAKARRKGKVSYAGGDPTMTTEDLFK